MTRRRAVLALCVSAATLTFYTRPSESQNVAAKKEHLRLDTAALQALVEQVQQHDSDALVIWHQGETVTEQYFDHDEAPIDTMSITKSVAALAIGKLINEGKLESLDTPVHSFYPEWNQGDKRRVTLRNLMNHTSGIQTDGYDQQSFREPDYVRLALAAELKRTPGSEFKYNNKAVNILAGIVELAAGQKLDAYVNDRFFVPLGITEYHWHHDRSGNPWVMAGLELHARDLVKIGRLIAAGGRWEDRELISHHWLQEMVSPSQPYNKNYGLLWWIPNHRVGVVERLRRWVTTYTDRPEDCDYIAEGSLGQYLVVYPRKQLVAVRLRRAREPVDYGPSEQILSDFPQLVDAL